MKYSKSGFTLVEVAIVMVIIGVLIGGILKGREMIESSRISSTIGKVMSTKSGMTTFRERYNAFPGDMLSATTKLAGCTAANYCINGNGDNTVGASNDTALWSVVVATQPETIQFWKHLALADLMTGVDPGADYHFPRKAVTNPQASVENAAFELFFNTGLMIGENRPSHWLRLTSNILDGSIGLGDIGAVSPHMAAQFERKMDDGNVNTGTLRVWDYGDQGCDNLRASGATNTVEESVENNTCVLFWKIKS